MLALAPAHDLAPVAKTKPGSRGPYRRGFMSAIFGPHAPTLAAVEAVSLATGKQLLKTLPADASLRAAFVVPMDAAATMDARLRSVMGHHGLSFADVADRIGLISVDGDLEDALPAIETIILDRRIDALIVDQAFASDAELWADLARGCDAAAMLVSRQKDPLAGDFSSIRELRIFWKALYRVTDIRSGKSTILAL